VDGPLALGIPRPSTLPTFLGNDGHPAPDYHLDALAAGGDPKALRTFSRAPSYDRQLLKADVMWDGWTWRPTAALAPRPSAALEHGRPGLDPALLLRPGTSAQSQELHPY